MNRRLITALALAFLVLSGRVARAQSSGKDPLDQKTNADWIRQQHTTFSDHDREITRDWYQHQDQKYLVAGWRRRDRLSSAMQARLRPGQPLGSELRALLHPLPTDLSLRYGPLPNGYRYAVVGGNIVILDRANEVHDVFTITL